MYIYIPWRFHPVDTGEVARWKFLAHYPRVSKQGTREAREEEKNEK